MNPEADATSRLAAYHAFFVVAHDDDLSYPMSFTFQQLSGLVLVLPFFFISKYLVGTDDYFEFVVVALMVNNVLNAGLVDLGLAVQTLISRGTFEFVLTQPIRWLQIPFLVLLWPLVVRVGLACVLLVTALLLGADLQLTEPQILVPTLVFSLVAATAIGVLGLAVRIQTKRSDPATTAYMFGLWIFSGVYFPVTSLPDILEPLAWLFPHTFAIDSIRSLTVPSAEPVLYSPTTSLVILGVYSAIGLPLSLFLFDRSCAQGRRTGSLTHY